MCAPSTLVPTLVGNSSLSYGPSGPESVGSRTSESVESLPPILPPALEFSGPPCIHGFIDPKDMPLDRPTGSSLSLTDFR